MEQKQRNKIAWVLAIVLVPLLIYLVVTNVAKVRKKSPPPAPSPATTITEPAIAPDAKVVPPEAEVQPPTQPAPPVDPKILAEQKRIAALLPENNPFNPSRSGGAEPSSAVLAPKMTTPPPVAAAPPAAPDAGIKLTAIMARGGGRMAMINGRFLGEGDRIAGWTIIKVTATEVLLDNGAKKMVLRLK